MLKNVVAEAVRVEVEDSTGKVFIVFEITDPKLKKDIKTNWVEDIEFRIIDKSLVLENE
ncbi:hypothetical protein UFOVP1290_44 [uncultured Caudovirales phage]|uniref:Uncharacterized protein n=1 Tax=uncultured Caudovirales phage TaxID=2100421 RepID=A0A6J5RWZ4_9CAUD|nr:hypothetical protein UFOVP1290_44 [uncultured Caudovirales phage]